MRLSIALMALCHIMVAGIAAQTPADAADQVTRSEDLGSALGPYRAIRSGPFLLEQYESDAHVRLFNMVNDPAQRTNIANQIPDKTGELLGKLRASAEGKPIEFQPRAQPITNPKELPPHVIRPQYDGSILLHSRDVEIHGTTVRYEPQTNKNTIGYWSRAADWVSWDFYVEKAGPYKVEILQGCGPKHGGSLVKFSCNGQNLEMTVEETKHFQDFITRNIGDFKFTAPGRYTLAVVPQKKPGGAVMDLRQVRLMPTSSASPQR